MRKFIYSLDDFSGYEKLRGMPMVYVLTTFDFKYTKIGIAKNIKQRMSNIQNGCPFTLSLYIGAHAPNVREIEKYLHDYFSDKNIRGEWFCFNDEDIDKLLDFFSALNNEVKKSFRGR